MKFLLTFSAIILGLSACAPALVGQQNDMISVSVSGTCPLEITGEARGFWYFEAVAPVKLFDSEGNLLVENFITADGEWMTEDFVPFHTELFYESSDENGVLIFEKSNPSGLPENDSKLEVPVKLHSC